MTMTADALVRSEASMDARPKRRTFTAEYKREILAEVDAAEAAGDSAGKGEILRREALYTSHIAKWRQAREDGTLASGRSGGRRRRSREEVEIDRLRDKNAALESELDRTKAALEIAGKAQELLEMFSESSATKKKSTP